MSCFIVEVTSVDSLEVPKLLDFFIHPKIAASRTRAPCWTWVIKVHALRLACTIICISASPSCHLFLLVTSVRLVHSLLSRYLVFAISSHSKSAMALTCDDVTVLVAEHLDMDSMLAFMLSSRANYQLIKRHERSIVKAKIASMVFDPVLMPPFGALLSSCPPPQPDMNRNVLDPCTFAIAKELELRERQINTIFIPQSASPHGEIFLDGLNRLPSYQRLPPDQMECLVDGFKDACRVAARIADCEASVRFKTEKASKNVGYYEGGERRPIEHKVHLARQQFIRSLSPIRLAFLTLLRRLAGMKYARQQFREPYYSDTFWERITAFEETFIRHGTAVISALLLPSEPAKEPHRAQLEALSFGVGHSPPRHSSKPAEYYASQVDKVLREVLEYEGAYLMSSSPDQPEGDPRPIPDSLHMTVLHAFQASEENEVEQRLKTTNEKEDADGNWLFNIDVTVFDPDSDDAEEYVSPMMLRELDPRDALILKWIRSTRHNLARKHIRVD
ncbi:hypothetical protein N657DRAFT_645310 [Parathielavia appendiculata]|uniref:Uncharacterized protein n=1 Tax=Parathielavia appendiculata TaxID=2587402 RepID=A0AAN6TZP3_9PEZI|nr:hypothetical protein N657DRAFT_645310 [Parathielavia appendiculata]